MGNQTLGLHIPLSVSNNCFKDLGNQMRMELCNRGHCPFIDGCSHPVSFLESSLFLYLKWFTHGQALRAFPLHCLPLHMVPLQAALGL